MTASHEDIQKAIGFELKPSEKGAEVLMYALNKDCTRTFGMTIKLPYEACKELHQVLTDIITDK